MFLRLLNNKYLLGLVAAIFFFISINTAELKQKESYKNIIFSDAMGYYQYLPGVFIENNLEQLAYAIPYKKSGKTINMYSIGVSVLEFPFYLIAHTYSLFSQHPTDGYSKPFSISIRYAAAFYLAISMFLLILTFKQYFKIEYVYLGVISIALGTNLFYYSTYEPGMSHIYNFFLISLLLYLTPLFYKNPSYKNALLVGFTISLIAVIKPNNLIITLFFFLYDVRSWKELAKRVSFFLKTPFTIFLLASSFFSFISLQMYYWFLISGKPILFTYGLKGEKFNWDNPHLLDVLISHQNGWLIYSPIMIFALFGIGFAIKNKIKNVYPALFIFLISYYVISSWWAWWFGGAFGHRAFIDFYPLYLFYFIYFIQLVFEKKRKWLIGVTLSLFILFIFYNLRMGILYSPPWDGNEWTWNSYLNVIKQAFYL